MLLVKQSSIKKSIVFCYQNCSDLMWGKKMSFESEEQEFAKVLRSLEQFIQTVKDQNIFGDKMFF